MEPVATMTSNEKLDTLLDVSIAQLTLKSAHPQVLPAGVASMDDVKFIFGQGSLQACLVSRSSLRQIFKLVGSSYEVAKWIAPVDVPNKQPEMFPTFESFREYFVPELYASEKAWLPAVM
eukprot:6073452-Prymnesium_polylepis.1